MQRPIQPGQPGQPGRQPGQPYAGPGSGAGPGPGGPGGYGGGYGSGYAGAGGAARTGALTPRARLAGALVCAILLGVEIAWIVRDFRANGTQHSLSLWVGSSVGGTEDAVPATGLLDVALVVALAVGLVTALAAARKAAVTWVFVAVGLYAALHRVSGLWIWTADWTKGAPLHGRALATVIAFVAGGVALVVAGTAGRAPAGTAGAVGVPGAAGADGTEVRGDNTPAPYRPNTVAAVLGGLLTVFLVLETAGWQAYFVQKDNDFGYPPHLYKHMLTGQGTIRSLLSAPPYYSSWVLVALGVLVVVVAFARAPLARPLGMLLGLTAAMQGAFALNAWHTQKALFEQDAPTWLWTEQAFEIMELVVGLVLLVLFAVRATERAPLAAPPRAWGPAAGPWGQGGPGGFGAPGAVGGPGGPGGPGASGPVGGPGAPGSPYGAPPPAWGPPPGAPGAGGPAPSPYQPPAGGFGPPPADLPPGTPPPPVGPPAGED